jgi:hypothetical protein
MGSCSEKTGRAKRRETDTMQVNHLSRLLISTDGPGDASTAKSSRELLARLLR